MIPVIFAIPLCEHQIFTQSPPCALTRPQDQITRHLRFEVIEGFGCATSFYGLGPDIALVHSWSILPSLKSIVCYYRASIPCMSLGGISDLPSARVVRVFYRQNQDMNRFLQSNNSITRTNYFRILALASIDIIVTLPLGAVSIALAVRSRVTALSPQESEQVSGFYSGIPYDVKHVGPPLAFSYADLIARGTYTLAAQYFVQWSSPVLTLAVFGLFGIASEARASYWRVICTIGSWFGWKPTLRTQRAHSPLGDIEFGERSMNLEIG